MGVGSGSESTELKRETKTRERLRGDVLAHFVLESFTVEGSLCFHVFFFEYLPQTIQCTMYRGSCSSLGCLSPLVSLMCNGQPPFVSSWPLCMYLIHTLYRNVPHGLRAACASELQQAIGQTEDDAAFLLKYRIRLAPNVHQTTQLKTITDSKHAVLVNGLFCTFQLHRKQSLLMFVVTWLRPTNS